MVSPILHDTRNRGTVFVLLYRLYRYRDDGTTGSNFKNDPFAGGLGIKMLSAVRLLGHNNSNSQ